jgi:ribosomal protein S18 acetylase RimI-like enzyme
MTIHIRCARSVDEFASIATSSEHISDTAHYLQRLFDTGYSRLAWCFVAEQADQAIARIALWALPKHDSPHDFVLFNTSWKDDDPAQRLLTHIETFFIAAGVNDIGHCQDLPPREPQWQTHEPERRRALDQAGFDVARHTLRYRFTENLPMAQPVNRLRLASINDTYDSVLLSLVAQVASTSHDQLDRDGCARLGAQAHAIKLIAGLREMQIEEDWWRIAYESQVGSVSEVAVGFVLPVGSADMGTIGYVGVLPAYRGKGYVDALIAHATQVLQRASFPRIVADTNRSNHPMAKAFERNGWKNFGERLEWTKKLN